MKKSQLTIQPYNHEDIGRATLTDIRWNNRTFGIQLDPKFFSAYEVERLISRRFYGEQVIVK